MRHEGGMTMSSAYHTRLALSYLSNAGKHEPRPGRHRECGGFPDNALLVWTIRPRRSAIRPLQAATEARKLGTARIVMSTGAQETSYCSRR